MTAALPRTVERLETEVDDALFTHGAQVAVEVAGTRVLDVALGDTGLGVPMTAEHVFRVYCTLKPITAVAIAQLVDAGAVALDEPLEQRLPPCRAIDGGVTLRNVLTHTAGLHRPMGIAMEITPPDQRRRVVEQTPRPTGWRLGVDAAYSEYAGWHILGWLLEAVTGQELREHLRSAVLDPLELHDTWIGMRSDEYRAVLPRLGVNHDVRDLNSFPMLFERSARVCQETNPAHGGYTTARDLARFYTRVLQQLAGDDVAGLPSAETLAQFCSDARPAVYDHVLDRVCPYGLGFMTSLEQHAFGNSCSASAFGHSGNMGASFAFADPDRDVAVAVVFNGLVGHDAGFLRRQALVTALYDDLDELARADDGAVADEDVGGPTRRRGGVIARLRGRDRGSSARP